jgi:hypothetical protein
LCSSANFLSAGHARTLSEGTRIEKRLSKEFLIEEVKIMAIQRDQKNNFFYFATSHK